MARSPAIVERYGVGQDAQDLAPGDFLLTRGSSWQDRLIRLGQRLRVEKRFCRYNHAALVIGEDGALAEALAGGVVETNISGYRDTAYHLVRINASPGDRREMVAFAREVLTNHYRYDWWAIASIALTLLTPARVVFGSAGALICSGFVALALHKTRESFPGAVHTTPADLAKRYGIT